MSRIRQGADQYVVFEGAKLFSYIITLVFISLSCGTATEHKLSDKDRLLGDWRFFQKQLGQSVEYPEDQYFRFEEDSVIVYIHGDKEEYGSYRYIADADSMYIDFPKYKEQRNRFRWAGDTLIMTSLSDEYGITRLTNVKVSYPYNDSIELKNYGISVSSRNLDYSGSDIVVSVVIENNTDYAFKNADMLYRLTGDSFPMLSISRGLYAQYYIPINIILPHSSIHRTVRLEKPDFPVVNAEIFSPSIPRSGVQ